MAAKKHKGAVTPDWRPNFRNTEALPDTKAIRTDFMFNFVALALAVGLLGYVGWVEFQIFSLNQQAEERSIQVKDLEPANRVNVQRSREFDQLSGGLEELVAFQQAPFASSELVQVVGALIPHEVLLSAMEVRANVTRERRSTTVQFELSITGTLDASSGRDPSEIMNEFKDQLESHEMVAPLLDGEALTPTFNRSTANAQVYNFRMTMRFNAPKN